MGFVWVSLRAWVGLVLVWVGLGSVWAQFWIWFVVFVGGREGRQGVETGLGKVSALFGLEWVLWGFALGLVRVWFGFVLRLVWVGFRFGSGVISE